MKSKLISTVALGAIVAFPAVASAQDSGWYLSGQVGAGQFSDAEIEGSALNTAGLFNTPVITTNANGDFGGALGLGYDFSNNWRVELEGSTLWNELGFDVYGIDADIRTTALMLNGIYDFNNFGNWQPYIGAGVGLIKSKVSGSTVADAFLPGNVDCAPGCSVLDDDTDLGWQVLAGLGHQITDRLTWDTSYRFQYAGTPDLEGINQTGPSKFDFELEDVSSHMISTGLRYRFGGASAAPMAAAAASSAFSAAPIAKVATYTCHDGTIGFSEACCTEPPKEVYVEPAQTYTCWDGSLVYDLATCAAQPAPEPVQTYSCWDNSVVYDLAQCPAVPAPVASYNNCGPSPVAIFNVDGSKSPKPLNRLGTMPEFGDSHNLNSTQFFEKLQAKYSANQNGDRAYLNYLFKSMGYTNGFRDADAYMFSEETLPVGTTGVLGLGEAHHYAYHVLPNNDKDRQAFRIQSANGSVVHFMKTCGNYMYACN